MTARQKSGSICGKAANVPVPREEIAGERFDALLSSISRLAEGICALNRQAVQEYTPVVEAILRTRSRDIRHIEHTLDGLLDFCGYNPALQLYRRLCRHYFDIDPAATVDYINAYREYWDPKTTPEAAASVEQKKPGVVRKSRTSATAGNSSRRKTAAPIRKSR